MDKTLLRYTAAFLQDHVINNQPQYFITLTLNGLYSDTEAISTFNFFTKSIQKPLKLERDVQGICFIERTWKEAYYEHQPHIHSVLWGFSSTTADTESFLRKRALMAALRLKSSRGIPMADMGTLDVQSVYDPEGLADYVTKDVIRLNGKRRPLAYDVKREGLDLRQNLCC